DIVTKQAMFYPDMISFENFCLETCSVVNFNESSYKLIIELENATINLSSIRYTTLEELPNRKPAFTQIETLKLEKNTELKINLSNYAYDLDNDSLVFKASQAYNITVLMADDIATIIPDRNFVGRQYIFFTVNDSINVDASNAVEIVVYANETVSKNESLKQGMVVIGKPVKWTKTVKLNGSVDNISVNISNDAMNLSVRKSDGVEISKDNIKVIDQGVEKTVDEFIVDKKVMKIDRDIDKLKDKKREYVLNNIQLKEINTQLIEKTNERNKITGYSVKRDGKGFLTRLVEWLFNVKITTYAVLDTEESNVTEVIIDEQVEEVEVEYYTEGPIAEEVNVSDNVKRVVVSSDVHYENILTYSYLEPQQAASAIKLYWLVNGSRQKFEFESFDTDSNGLVDYIQWITPSLSNQTFEIVIEITAAEHLDSDRNFIADIYDYVKERDDNWTEIPDGHYVRVSFEQELDSSKDITIYARANEISFIEVYEKDSDVELARFENIAEEGYYKIYLTELAGKQDTFDLKIDGDVEFDWIVDPNIVSQHKNYTKNYSPYGGIYPDTGNAELTDGSLDTTEYTDPEWVGWYDSQTPVVITVDLEDNYNLDYVRFHYLIQEVFGIYDPTDLVVNGSTDNSTWTNLGTFAAGTDWNNTDANSYWSNNLSVSGTYRYIQFTFTKDGANWLFLDEIEVYEFTDTIAPSINFTAPTPDNGSSQLETNVKINVSIEESNLYSVIYNWNGTNYTMYNDSLLLMMNFDNVSALGENDTYVVDVSNYGNNGTAYGNAITTISGKYNRAFMFDGNGDYISIGSLGSFPPKGTIMFWIKQSSILPVYGNPLATTDNGENEGIRFEYEGGGEFRVIAGGDGSVGENSWVLTSSMTTDIWYYVVATWDTSTNVIKGYWNGVNTVNVSHSSWASNLANVVIGRGFNLGRYWNGSIDEVRIWNRSLSQSEIQHQYISNLYKFNSTQWYLYVNQSKNATAVLTDGEYSYQAFASDSSGNMNSTEVRSITIDSTLDLVYPKINFTYPTPVNGSSQLETNVMVNVSIEEINLSEVVYNWNGTNYTLYDDSLILMYNFDNVSALGENNTYVVDVVKGTNNATGVNFDGNEIVSGKYNKAIYFDGTGEYMYSTDLTQLEGRDEMSVEAWIKPATSGAANSNRQIVSKWYGTDSTFDLGYRNLDSNTLTFGIYTDGVYSAPSNQNIDNTDGWVYLVGTYNSTHLKLYINGELDNTSLGSGALKNSGQNLVIGCYSSACSSSYNFNGMIDEVRIWNRSLTSDEIQQQYMSNLYKYNQTRWYLQVNQSKNSTTVLSDGTYPYQSFASDSSGNENSTEVRSITIDSTLDTIYPLINFTAPTPNNASTDTDGNVVINVTIEESNLEEVVYNWNGTNESTLMLTSSNITFNFTSSGLNSLSFDNGTQVTSLFNDSLVLMMNFDNVSALGENSTYVVDVSNGKYNGTWSGEQDANSGWTTSGKLSGAMNFDGSGDYVATQLTDISGSELTVSYWFKGTVSASAVRQQANGGVIDYLVFPWSSDWTHVMSNDGGTGSGISVDNNGGNTLNDNTWHFVSVTWKQNTQSNGFVSYFDGIKIANRTSSNTLIPNVATAVEFGRYQGGSEYTNGTIDEVRIWNRSLSSDEIYQSYVSNLNKYNRTKWHLYINQSPSTNFSIDINGSSIDIVKQDADSYYITHTKTDLSNGNYTYQACATDTSANQNCTETRTLNVTANQATVGMEYIYPTTDINVLQNQFFNVTVNVTCYTSDCGEINISLDPISANSVGLSNEVVSVGNKLDKNMIIVLILFALSVSCLLFITCKSVKSRLAVSLSLLLFIFGCAVSITDVTQSSTVTAGENFTAEIQPGFANSAPLAPFADLAVMIPNGWDVAKSNYSGDYSGVISASGLTDPEAATSGYKWWKGRADSGYTSTTSTAANATIIIQTNSTGGSYTIKYWVGNSYDGWRASTTEQINSTASDSWFGTKGLISTTPGTTPFYTNKTSNPFNISLIAGESRSVTFWVNATGSINHTYEFFVYANVTSSMSISNRTEVYNVTISEDIVPTWSSIPANVTIKQTIQSLSVDFDAIDNFAISSYFINDTNNFAINSTNGTLTNATALEIGI
ncbi:MAG: LamG-like jellyroll fold domain-containing protein, partial [Nanoarchaeota archaeon]